MPGLKNNPIQILWLLTIFASTYLLLKKFINKFCHQVTNFDGLEKNNYDSILIIIDRLTKMVYYKPVKITINTSDLAEIIINIMVRYYGFLDLIVTNQRLLFTSKF